jgi:hypothetical protein
VADRLGFRYVDDEVLEQAGEWADLSPEFVATAERRKPLMDRVLGVGHPSLGVLPAGHEGRALPADETLRGIIKQVLSSIAEEGSTVIVAHAASFALSGPQVLRVWVTASPETRAQRLAEQRGVELRDATGLLKQEDVGRADYLKRFYGVKQELPTHFDVVVNTDVLTAEQAVDVIVAACG